MESIKQAISEILTDNSKLYSIHWLLSLVTLVNLVPAILLSFVTKKFDKNSIARYYFIRGLIAFRLLCYGCLFGGLFRRWINSGLPPLSVLSYPVSGITIFEVFVNSVFYYCILIMYYYDNILPLTITAELLLQILGDYPILRVLHVILIIITATELNLGSKHKILGKLLPIISSGILMSIIPALLKLFPSITS